MDTLLDLRHNREVGEATNSSCEDLAVNQVVDYRLTYQGNVLLADERCPDNP